MYIISKFRDYYDSVAKYGKDMGVVYERKEMVFDVRQKDTPKIVTDLREKILRSMTDDEQKDSERTLNATVRFLNRMKVIGQVRNPRGDIFSFSGVFIVFCGDVYYGVRLHTERKAGLAYTCESAVFYSSGSLIAHLEKEGVDLDAIPVYGKHSPRTSILARFNRPNHASFRDWFIENKITVAVMENHDIIINPQLQSYQFYKAVDCVTAYQEIDMWISGTLAFPQNVVIEIEDKYKIQEHGFDKWSFRKMPQKRA